MELIDHVPEEEQNKFLRVVGEWDQEFPSIDASLKIDCEVSFSFVDLNPVDGTIEISIDEVNYSSDLEDEALASPEFAKFATEQWSESWRRILYVHSFMKHWKLDSSDIDELLSSSSFSVPDSWSELLDREEINILMEKGRSKMLSAR